MAVRDDGGRGRPAGGHAARLATGAVPSASDGEKPAAKRRRRPVERTLFALPLFDRDEGERD